jgi:hypothetical protein
MSSPPPARTRLLALLLLAPFSAAVATAAETKGYTLFMGTDLSVQQEKDYYRIVDVDGGMFVVRMKNEEVRIPMRRGSGSLKVDQGFKLTPVAAQIDKLKTDRAYTAANDPYVKFNSRSGAAQGSDAAMSISYANVGATQSGLANANATVMRSIGTSGEAAARENAATVSAKADNAMNEYADSAYGMSKQSFNNPGLAALELQQELAEENFDAMRYSFEVSSATPLNRPYLVFIVRYHEKDAPPGTKQGTVIYAKSIAAIGERPSKVTILQTGLPVGFVVEECQVRLYNEGQEVATNVAPRRVAMSRDEAFLYLKIDRIGRAKGATLPAAPALGRLDEETKSRLTLDQLKQVYYVKVSKEGRAEQVFLDSACTQPADATVTGVVETIRFYPALEKNKEQAGTAKLLFAHIPI